MSSQSPMSLTIDESLKERVERLAAARQRTTDWLMSQAIVQYLDIEVSRDCVRSEALTAWDDYRTTGRHLTAEEADAWLARLEAGEDLDVPACHV